MGCLCVCVGGWVRGVSVCVFVCSPWHHVHRSQVQAFSSAHFGQGNATSQIWLDQVDCTGNESRLTDCSANALGDHDCSHAEDAGVSCGTTSSGGESETVNAVLAVCTVSSRRARRLQISVKRRRYLPMTGWSVLC